MRKGFIYIDPEKCLACRTCELECAVAHSVSKNLAGSIAEVPSPAYRINVQCAGDTASPFNCRHCEDAPCIAVCPAGAVKRENPESPVLVEEEKCIGCKYCIIVCPFGVINLDKSGRAVLKCDLCVERLKEGMVPACAAACPTKALKFRDIGSESAGDREKSIEKIRKVPGNRR